MPVAMLCGESDVQCVSSQDAGVGRYGVQPPPFMSVGVSLKTSPVVVPQPSAPRFLSHAANTSTEAPSPSSGLFTPVDAFVLTWSVHARASSSWKRADSNQARASGSACDHGRSRLGSVAEADESVPAGQLPAAVRPSTGSLHFRLYVYPAMACYWALAFRHGPSMWFYLRYR